MKRIFVAGHLGMVGSAICRTLRSFGNCEIITRNRSDLDLTIQQEVQSFFQDEKIDQVYLAAAKVGGIESNNTFPAEFIYQNLIIECNVIHSAHLSGVSKLLFLGSSCIYPKLAEQPMTEEALLTGKLEPTNEPYAVAKIAGIKLCESYNRQYGRDYRSVMPTNLYGPEDNFHPNHSHVIPALMQRFHKAKVDGVSDISVWGSGKSRREFLYVEDMAEASVFIMSLGKSTYDSNTLPMLSHINVGTGLDCTIKELVKIVVKVIGYEGNIHFDVSKPDGAPRKLLNVSRIGALGWNYKYSLEQGLTETYQWYLDNQESVRQ